MAYLGLFGGLALLILLALRGVNIVFASVLCSLVVIVTNGLPLAESLSQYYALGPLGTFTFAGKFFLLFAAGAIFGRVMGESHAATSISLSMLRSLGAKRVLWIATLASALLTYGGVVIFVIIFAMYPLGLQLLQQTNTPKRLLAGALALGAGTFTLTALPGTPSIHNVISSVALGTDLYAGGWLGLLGGAIMFGLGIWYLEYQRLLAIKNGEGFVAGPNDRILDADVDGKEYPHWLISILPVIFVLLVIMLPRLMNLIMADAVKTGQGPLFDLLRFAGSQQILWPSIALVCGTLLAILMMPAVRCKTMNIFSLGTHDSIMPLMSTAAVIGFGGVVTQTAGFQEFTRIMVDSSLPPLISMFASINLVAGITGSAAGGLQIFMKTMSQDYLAMGIDPAALHRLVTMASGGLDSLPHSGAVIALLTIMGLTHKETYRDIFVITVVIPLFASVVAIGAYAVFS